MFPLGKMEFEYIGNFVHTTECLTYGNFSQSLTMTVAMMVTDRLRTDKQTQFTLFKNYVIRAHQIFQLQEDNL